MSFFARTKTNANGVQTTFPVSFPLAPVGGRNWVGVYVHSVSDPHPGAAKVAGVDFNWVSDGQIAFTGGHVPANGTVVEVRRLTNITVLDNTIQAGGSLRSAELAQNDTQLLNLTQELADADADLQSQLDVESTARIAGDTTLTTNLTAETNARIAADGVEAATRIAADNALTAGLNTEIAARVAAVAGEAASRASAINTEVVNRNAAIAAETVQRVQGDASLEAQLSTINRHNTFNINGVASTSLPINVFTPEQFAAYKPSGIVGDGTDDGPAFAAMSAALNAIGRGAIYYKTGATYWVGGQTHNGAVPAGTYTWAPSTLYSLEIANCDGPVVVMGNGAKIKTLAGKRYGTFDDAGVAMATGAGYTGTGISTPYLAMIFVHGCSGPVKIVGLELDGNIANCAIGGLWGDFGRQLPMTGISLQDNTGPIDIDVCPSHGHGLDGIIGDGPGLLTAREMVRVNNSSFHENGRQGCSLVGGNGWTFNSCKFARTGKNIGSMAYSAPGAGCDLESEGVKYVINTSFNDCEFVDNVGVGLIGDTATNTFGVICRHCKFVGTDDWSVWPHRPQWVFEDCYFLGAMVDMWNDPDPTKTCRFIRCHFSTNKAYSPTGYFWNDESHGGGGVARIMDGGGGTNYIIFDRCSFEEFYATTLCQVFGNFIDCSFSANGHLTYLAPFGTFSGKDTIFTDKCTIPRADIAVAQSTLYAGASYDSFTWQGTRYEADTDRATGKRLYYGSATWDPANDASGAQVSTTITVIGAVLGDFVEDLSFDNNLAGLDLAGFVSANDTVTVTLNNLTGGAINLASGTLRCKVRAH